MDCTADLPLTFVWDDTASGTGKSNTEIRLNSWYAPRLCMGKDCLWDSAEQYRGEIAQLI